MDCRVVIYGASLYMVIVEATLKNQPGLTVVHIDPAQQDSAQHLHALHPEVILVDETTSVLLASLDSTASPNNGGEAAIIVLLPTSPIVAVRLDQQHRIQNIQELTELVWLSCQICNQPA